MTRLRCRSSSQHFGHASNASSACTWGSRCYYRAAPADRDDGARQADVGDRLHQTDGAGRHAWPRRRCSPRSTVRLRSGTPRGGGRCRRPFLCRRARGAIHLAPGARKDGQTRTLQQAVECVGQAYRERSRGLDSPLGIAGALVLEGGVHRWRELRMTDMRRAATRSGTNPTRARPLRRFRPFLRDSPVQDRLISIEVFGHHEANIGHGWRSELKARTPPRGGHSPQAEPQSPRRC
jgi:hypothetical protein